MKKPAKPRFFHSLLYFGRVIFIVIFGFLGLEINLHVLLIASLTWASFHVVKLGFNFFSMNTAISMGIEKGLGAIYIFSLIGVLISVLDLTPSAFSNYINLLPSIALACLSFGIFKKG